MSILEFFGKKKPTTEVNRPNQTRETNPASLQDPVKEIKDLLQGFTGALDFLSKAKRSGFQPFKEDSIGLYLSKGECCVILSVLPNRGPDKIWGLAMYATKQSEIVHLVTEGKLTFSPPAFAAEDATIASGNDATTSREGLRNEVIDCVRAGDRDRLRGLIKLCTANSQGLAILEEAKRQCDPRWHALKKDLQAAISSCASQSATLPIDEADTVRFRDAGLMWEKKGASGMTWETALAYAASLRLGGYRDWRLPTIKELQRLCYIHPEQVPPGMLSSEYWTSEEYENCDSDAHYVDFSPGIYLGTTSYAYKTRLFAVRCCRNC